MSRWRLLTQFEDQKDVLNADQLLKWRQYWMSHASQLQPKVKKLALKRIHEIDVLIEKKRSEN